MKAIKRQDLSSPTNGWLDALSYPRVILVMPFTFLWTGLFSVIVFLFGTMGFRGLTVKAARTWAWGTLAFSNVNLTIEGKENLPDQGALFLFNHSSHFDIPVVILGVPKPLRWGAKIELFKIPLFGMALRAYNCFPIVRKDREKVLELYDSLINEVKQGDWLILAPEGTRQSGEKLGRFKSGPFIFGINGQFPLVPMVLCGVHKALPSRSLLPGWGRWRSEVIVKILPSIETNGLTLDQRVDLQKHVYEKMSHAYHEGLTRLDS